MRKFGMFLLVTASLSLSGCCLTREIYNKPIERWEKNLLRLRDTVKRGEKDLPEDLKGTKVGLLEDTIRGMKRVRKDGPEVWNKEVSGE